MYVDTRVPAPVLSGVGNNKNIAVERERNYDIGDVHVCGICLDIDDNVAMHSPLEHPSVASDGQHRITSSGFGHQCHATPHSTIFSQVLSYFPPMCFRHKEHFPKLIYKLLFLGLFLLPCVRIETDAVFYRGVCQIVSIVRKLGITSYTTHIHTPRQKYRAFQQPFLCPYQTSCCFDRVEYVT